MTGTDKRYVIDLAEAQRLWVAQLDCWAGTEHTLRAAVAATLRQFLSRLTVPGEPRRVALRGQSQYRLGQLVHGLGAALVLRRLASGNDRARTDRAVQLSRLSLRQPPARLLAMICLNMAVRAGALMVSPSRMATVRAVLLP